MLFWVKKGIYVFAYLHLYFCCSLWYAVSGLSVVEWEKMCSDCNSENLGYVVIARSIGNLVLCVTTTFVFNYLKTKEKAPGWFSVTVHKSLFCGVSISYLMLLFPFLRKLSLILMVNLFIGFSYGLVFNSCTNCMLCISENVIFIQLLMVSSSFASFSFPFFMAFVMKLGLSPDWNLAIMYGVPLALQLPVILFLIIFPSPYGEMGGKPVKNEQIEVEIDVLQDLSDKEEIQRVIEKEEDLEEEEDQNDNENGKKEEEEELLPKLQELLPFTRSSRNLENLPLSSQTPFANAMKQRRKKYQRLLYFVGRKLALNFLSYEQFCFLIVSTIMMIYSSTESSFSFVIISYLVKNKIMNESDSMFLLSSFFLMYTVGRISFVLLSIRLTKLIKQRYVYIFNMVGMLFLSSLHLIETNSFVMAWIFVTGMGLFCSSGYSLVYNLPKSFFGVKLTAKGTSWINLGMCIGYFGGYPVNFLYSKNSKLFIMSMIFLFVTNIGVGFGCFILREIRKQYEKNKKKRNEEEKKRKKKLKIIHPEEEVSDESNDITINAEQEQEKKKVNDGEEEEEEEEEEDMMMKKKNSPSKIRTTTTTGENVVIEAWKMKEVDGKMFILSQDGDETDAVFVESP